MKIICPSCDTAYDVSANMAPEGTKVRCARCGDVWHAIPVPDEEPAPEPELEFMQPAEFDDDIVFEESANETESEITSDEADAEFEAFLEAQDASEVSQGESDEELDISFESVAQDDTDLGEDAVDPASFDDIFDEEAEPESEPELASEEDTDEAESAGLDVLPEPEPETDDDEMSELLASLSSHESSGQPENAGSRNWVGWGSLFAAVAVVVLSLYQFRVQVVKVLPGAAGLYSAVGLPVNIRGIAFGNVSYRWKKASGRPALEVHGEVVNLTEQPRNVPLAIFSMRDKRGYEIYKWADTIATAPLFGLERKPFIAVIPAPRRPISSVQVQFFSAQ